MNADFWSAFLLPLPATQEWRERSGRRPAWRRVGHPARRIVVRASPSLPRSELPFRAARCRPLRQPRWLPLHPQAETLKWQFHAATLYAMSTEAIQQVVQELEKLPKSDQ